MVMQNIFSAKKMARKYVCSAPLSHSYSPPAPAQYLPSLPPSPSCLTLPPSPPSSGPPLPLLRLRLENKYFVRTSIIEIQKGTLLIK